MKFTKELVTIAFWFATLILILGSIILTVNIPPAGHEAYVMYLGGLMALWVTLFVAFIITNMLLEWILQKLWRKPKKK